MRYLVTARVKPGRERALAQAIEDRTLGAGSIAGNEYLRNMECARRLRDGSVKWVEVCFCETPLQEERPYWEEYFDLVKVQDAHARQRCKDLNGDEPWACSECDCTEKLEARLATWGPLFLDNLLAAPDAETLSRGESDHPLGLPSALSSRTTRQEYSGSLCLRVETPKRSQDRGDRFCCEVEDASGENPEIEDRRPGHAERNEGHA